MNIALKSPHLMVHIKVLVVVLKLIFGCVYDLSL